MGRRVHRDLAVLAGALLLTACGGGGGGTSGSSGGGGSGLTGNLSLLGHVPENDAVQVPLDTSVEMAFDGVVVPECLADGDSYLEATASAQRVEGAWAVVDGGRTVRFTPSARLAAATEYTMHVGALVCDTGGRILEDAIAFSFQTLDSTPPTVSQASVAPGAIHVSRTQNFTITFSERLLPATVASSTVYLRDAYGATWPAALTLQGSVVTVDPLLDLAGDRAYTLAARGGTSGIKDRAGNLMAASWNVSFRTIADTTAPRALSGWPNGGTDLSPLVQPAFTFDESMDPASVEATSVLFVDSYASFVTFTVAADSSQRTLRLVPNAPLVPGRAYVLALLTGPAGPTDLSGNPLQIGSTISFSVGNDTAAPTLTSSHPAALATRVSLNATPTLTFSEALDATRSTTATIRLDDGTQDVAIALNPMAGGTRLQVVPVLNLRPSTRYTLTCRGGAEGLRDQHGIPLAADISLSFTTADDATLPSVFVQPPHGALGVPRGARISAVFSEPLDPSTVSSATVQLRDAGNQVVPGTVTLLGSGRVVRFTPATNLAGGAPYTLTLTGGAGGLRETSGNGLADDLVSNFRVGFGHDTIAPVVSLTLNAAADVRKSDMVVPPFGFTLEVDGYDPGDYSLDMGTVQVTIEGPGAAPGPETILAAATLTAERLSYRLPIGNRLAAGKYTLRATLEDLSGNVGAAGTLPFTVQQADQDTLPFERTQVVWVRFDLDRDGNGKPDLEDDLLRLGFQVAGDGSGTNARMAAVVRDAILAQANALLHRAADSATLGDASVPIRLTSKRPYGLPHMQIACSGFDPEGAAGRRYGNDSTGTLGRAYYDHKNSSFSDLNIATRPGLGVFPAEMFLYQAAIHIQVYPAYTTTFARRFLNICPQMGGTPAGAHALDSTVLASGFDFETASLAQRARYLAVFSAADDWALAIGTVLAHEIGHAVGLTAAGHSPRGLHGDESLHDEYAGSTDVMAPAVSYEGLVALPFSFRDLNLAYLRQRLLLR